MTTVSTACENPTPEEALLATEAVRILLGRCSPATWEQASAASGLSVAVTASLLESADWVEATPDGGIALRRGPAAAGETLALLRAAGFDAGGGLDVPVHGSPYATWKVLAGDGLRPGIPADGDTALWRFDAAMTVPTGPVERLVLVTRDPRDGVALLHALASAGRPPSCGPPVFFDPAGGPVRNPFARPDGTWRGVRSGTSLLLDDPHAAYGDAYSAWRDRHVRATLDAAMLATLVRRSKTA